MQNGTHGVDSLVAYVQITLRDSNDNLVNYIESERMAVSNLTAINDYLDDIKGEQLIDDASVHKAAYSFTKKNVTFNEQDLEMVTIRHQGVYRGINSAASKTYLAPTDTWHLITNTDGYPIHTGDHFDSLWTILRPIS